MRVFFARHGQSRSNLGLPCDNFADIALTDLGHEQAAELAAYWTETPDLIVVSPYLRTQETAAPTRHRFSEIPVEVWPVQEFTNLHATRWCAIPEVKWAEERRQWEACDPHFTDGDGTESFLMLHERARAVLDRLATLPPNHLVYAFSHGYFMHAVRLIIEQPDLPIGPRMRFFRPDHNSRPFLNTQTFGLEFQNGQWSILPSHLLRLPDPASTQAPVIYGR